jgi:hypothetical protein
VSGSFILTDFDVAKYQELCKKWHGTDLDKNTAKQELTKLVHQMELIYRPITQEEADSIAANEYGELNESAVKDQ